MKCRVGLLQQSRPFSTVYSKREAALESSLQPTGVSLRQPSLKAGRPSADRHWSCSCWGTCLFPFQEVNILALSGWDGCQRNVAPLGKWKALLGLLTLPIKLAGIERLHSKQPRVLALLTILLLLLCLVQQNEVTSFLTEYSDFHLFANWRLALLARWGVPVELFTSQEEPQWVGSHLNLKVPICSIYLDKTQVYEGMNDFSENSSIHCGYVTSF